MGCTHYPIIEKEIEKNLNYRANIIDPAKVLSKNIKFEENEKTNIQIYMTDVNKVSQKMVNKIMEREIEIRGLDD